MSETAHWISKQSGRKGQGIQCGHHIKTIDESGMSINYAAATLIRPCHKKSESNEKAIRLRESVPTDQALVYRFLQVFRNVPAGRKFFVTEDR